MSRNDLQSIRLSSMQTSNFNGLGQYPTNNSELYGSTAWTASHASQQPNQLVYNPYYSTSTDPAFADRQLHANIATVLQPMQFASATNGHDENGNYLLGTLNPPAIGSEPESQYQQQNYIPADEEAVETSPQQESGSASDEGDGSDGETASNDGVTVDGNDDDESTSKLEKSRQSARECRARKKLRYQYLESLVDARKQSVAQLKDELAQFEAHAKLFDQGEMPPGLIDLLNDRKSNIRESDGASAITSKERANKTIGSKAGKAAGGAAARSMAARATGASGSRSKKLKAAAV